MGLTDIFSKKKNDPSSQKPKTEMPKIDLPQSKQDNDLEKLKAFEEKIMMRSNGTVTQTQQASTEVVSQEEMALKLKNPFRGV